MEQGILSGEFSCGCPGPNGMGQMLLQGDNMGGGHGLSVLWLELLGCAQLNSCLLWGGMLCCLSPYRAHRLFTTEGSIAFEQCLCLPQRKEEKFCPVRMFHEASCKFAPCISFRKTPTVQTGFLICSWGKGNPPGEAEIRRTATLHRDHRMRIGKHSNCLEAQSAPLTASSVCSAA